MTRVSRSLVLAWLVGVILLVFTMAFLFQSMWPFWVSGSVPSRAVPRPLAYATPPRPLYRLSGSPHERGRTHGLGLAREIAASLKRLLPTDQAAREFVTRTYSLQVLSGLPAPIREEIDAIAEGSGRTVEEILFLSTRFELAALGLLQGPRLGGEGGLAEPPAVTRGFVREEMELLRSDLVLLVHEEGQSTTLLLTLPGMVGGFLGARGSRIATFVPDLRAGRTLVGGIPWTILLRLALEEPREDLLARSTASGWLFVAERGGRSGTFTVDSAGCAFKEMSPAAGMLDAWTVRMDFVGETRLRIRISEETESITGDVELAR